MPEFGLDVCVKEGFAAFKGQSIALVCNQASVSSDFRHILDCLLPLHQSGYLKVQCVFGPQHGIWGHTQDIMVEWEGYRDARTGLTFFSLYGEHREPTPAMLEGVERLVFDVPDIGRLGFRLVVVETHCRHTFPLRYGERFRVNAWFRDVDYRLCVAYELTNLAHDRRAARGHTTLVTTDPQGQLLLATPQGILDRLG